MWGRVITPLWCLKAPSPATKKWIFEFYTKFGFRNHLQTFWPQWLVKSELSLGLLRELRVYGLRPGQTSHCLQVRDRKWGARGPSGRLASAKLVIHVKYGIFIYHILLNTRASPNRRAPCPNFWIMYLKSVAQRST